MERSGTAGNARAPSANGSSVLIGGKPDRIGRVQCQIRRAFVAADGKPLRIGDLLPRCFPGVDCYARWMRKSIHRALPKFGVSLGRTSRQGRPILWAPKPELARLIGHTENLCAAARKN